MFNENEGIAFEGVLPFSVKVLSALPPNDQLALTNLSNENYLRANLILEDTPDLDEHNEINQELRRQDLKLNLILDLFGELLAQNKLIPDDSMIRFNSSGLICSLPANTQAELFKVGACVEMEIFISPQIPKALKLYGDVQSINEASRLTITFNGLTNIIEESLEKIVFRQHRRTIAQSKWSRIK